MKILVTGARGMLGLDLCRALRAHGHSVNATPTAELDVRKPDQVRATFASFRPERVYHLAALTNVDACEQSPEAAYHTNTLGTQLVALNCAAADIPLVYISTIAVFDGHINKIEGEF